MGRLRRIQTRSRRTDASLGDLACTALDQGELDPFHRRRHRDDSQRRHGRVLRPRAGTLRGARQLAANHAIEPGDVSSAIAWLVSDEARFVTGVTLSVDAGFNVM
jgi:NAD(P)-dependent dehydrogenase (short-subunit alcohol dehydrogenase family)